MYLILNTETNNFHVSSLLTLGTFEVNIVDFDFTAHFLSFFEYYYYDVTSKIFLFDDVKYQSFLFDEYSRNRKKEYLELNQNELRYDDLINNTNTWGEAIEAIKLKYPKPEAV